MVNFPPLALLRRFPMVLVLGFLLLFCAGQGCAEQASTGQPSSSTVTGSGQGGAGGVSLSSNATGPGSGGVNNVCGTAVAEVERDPVDVVVLLDRSQSMAGKWTKLVDALGAFFTDPRSAGIRVGLNVFPAVGTVDSCAEEDYASLALSLGELPDYSQTLVSALNAWNVAGKTPTWGALKGTYAFAESQAQSSPERPVIVIFASDGDPCCGACEKEDPASLAALASGALGAGVETYVIAIEGSTLATLDAIAQAGGTEAAFDITSNIDLLTGKLEEIRHAALGCEYVVPDPPDGEQLNPNEVNVTFKAGGASEAETFVRVDDASFCGAERAWHYDDPAAPTRIMLCPVACGVVASDLDAQLEVVFGCASVVK